MSDEKTIPTDGLTGVHGCKMVSLSREYVEKLSDFNDSLDAAKDETHYLQDYLNECRKKNNCASTKK